MVGKAIRITAIVLASLLLVMVLVPVLFRGKIFEHIRERVFEQFDAQIETGSFGLSLIRQFPLLTFWVRDVEVIGRGDFAGDTLADVGRLMVSLDLLKLIRGDEYEINRIRLDHPTINLKLMANGSANWNIIKVTEEEAAVDESAGADVMFGLKRVEIVSGKLTYLDDKYLTYIDAADINSVLRGDLSMSQTRLFTRDATVSSLSIRYDKWPLLSRVMVRLTAEMDADLERLVFVFRDNQILINELPLVFEGMVGWPVEDLEMDIRFSSARSDFASFLSVLPAMYTSDFDRVTTAGSLKLDGHVKGAYTSEEYPGFGLTAEVENGMFQYPGLPASIDNIRFRARIDNPGRDLDLTVVEVPVFSMALAGTPVSGHFYLRNPLSDPGFDIGFRGRVDLSETGRYLPLGDGYVLRGVADGDLEMKGTLSSFENADYQNIHAAGKFLARELFIQIPDLNVPLEIDVAEVSLNPRELKIETFNLRMGDSDLSATGSITNLAGYLFDRQLLRGVFATQSSFFDLNMLMDSSEEDEQITDELLAGGEEDGNAGTGNTEGHTVSVISIPDNIDFTLHSKFDRMLFGRLDVENVVGIIQVADEQVNLENLRLNMLGGSLELNGIYDSRDRRPWVNFGLNILGFDIDQTFQSFVIARLLAPVGEFARGNFSASLQLSSLLNERLQPVIPSLKGNGNFSSSSVALENTPLFSSLAGKLQMDQFREISLKDLVLSFVFSDGKVELPPVELTFGEVKARVTGMTYFDRRLSYVMNLEIPRSFFGGQANQVLDDLIARSGVAGFQVTPGATVPVDVYIGGRFNKPEVSVSLATLREDIEQQLRDEASRMVQETQDRIIDQATELRDSLEEEARAKAEEVRDQVNEELETRAGQIMEEAHRQAAVMRQEASALAERVRAEGREQAARLEKEASGQGPLAQVAARQAAQQVVREADRRAAQIEAEAERNIQKLLEEATRQADRVRRGEE